MLSPVLRCDGNEAELSFFTRFGHKKKYRLSKKSCQRFSKSFTAINEIDMFDAWVDQIYPAFVILRTSTWMPIYASYGEELKYGQQVYAIERFSFDEQFKWIAASRRYRDVKCLYINFDILENDKIIYRLRIDPFTGQSKELSCR
jgi:hypothetical protein